MEIAALQLYDIQSLRADEQSDEGGNTAETTYPLQRRKGSVLIRLCASWKLAFLVS
jgi:hypothetical protein